MVGGWSSTILPTCTHINRRFSTQSADIFGHKSAVRQLWTICGHKSTSFLQLLGPAHALSKYTQDDDTSRVLYRQISKRFAALHGKEAPKSFALCLDQLRYVRVASRLNFRSQKWSVDIGLLHFGEFSGSAALTAEVAGCQMTFQRGFWVEWLHLSALDNIGKRLWVDMIGSRFIRLVGWRLKDNQDYLVEEPRWISPPSQ